MDCPSYTLLNILRAMTTIHVNPVRRRRFLSAIGSIAAFSILGGSAQEPPAPARRKGRLKQSVCRGVFSGLKLDLDGQCREAAKLGVCGIDLVDPSDFPTLKKYGLVPTMVHGGTGIKSGINDRKNHLSMETKVSDAIKAAAEA